MCLFIHIGAQIILALQNRMGFAQRYAAARPILFADFLLFILLALLCMNRFSLRSAQPQKHAVPLSIRRRSILLVTVMFFAAVVLASLPAIAALIAQAGRMLWKALVAFAGWIASVLPQTGAPGGLPSADSGTDFSSLGEAAKPGLLLIILEKIAIALAFAAVFALLLLALKKLWKLLRRAGKWLHERLKSYMSAASEDYVDEVESTRETGESSFRSALRRRSLRRKTGALSAREKVRFLYADMRRRHPEWRASQTARDTLPSASAGIYERARYSKLPVTDEEAREFDKLHRHG